MDMETVRVPGTDLEVSRIALGTWAIGGWMWGGTDETAAIDTVYSALDHGINLIDTAPVYGFGKAETIVGKAVKTRGRRDRVALATKAGLEWKNEEIFRNSEPSRIAQEVDGSLRRLQTDYIDILFVHWPDPRVPYEETARIMEALRQQGKIRAVGVSNYAPAQMEAFRRAGEINICQPPYNIFERGIEADVMPYCKEHGIALMTYGALCRGLLSGEMTHVREFKDGDLRKADPKFQEPQLSRYLKAAARLEQLAKDHAGKSLLPAAVRWILDQGVEIAIWGARRPDQIKPVDAVFGWQTDEEFNTKVDVILAEELEGAVGSEFMAPPERGD